MTFLSKCLDKDLANAEYVEMGIFVCMTAMKKKINIQLALRDACTGCAACASVCPKGCISMQEDREGFLMPVIAAGVHARLYVL